MKVVSEISYFDEEIIAFVVNKACEVAALMEKIGLVQEKECYDYCVLFFADLLLKEGDDVLQRMALDMTLEHLKKELERFFAADNFSADRLRRKEIIRNFFREDNFIKKFRLIQADIQKTLNAFKMSNGDRDAELKKLRSKNASFFLSKNHIAF